MIHRVEQLVSNRYRLLGRLGEGGMGTVYQAHDRLTGDTVALKHVTAAVEHLTFASDQHKSNPHVALAQEFRLLASLRHPNIVSVLDYGFDEQRRPYYTMSYLQGGQTILQAGQGKPLAGKIRLLVQLLQALAYLHRRGVIHRDLKPENSMVVAEQVKVVDFGLSLVREHSVDTKTQNLIGTLAYMAPETLEGRTSGRAADLYAVGVMAYELFAGHHPFDTKNLTVLINQTLNAPPDLSALGVNEAIARVVEKLLLKSRAARYHNANEVIRDLCAAANVPIPPETAAIRESFLQAAKFVGRKQEMAQLWEVWQTATTGQGSVWLIGGESGVGKSRLLDEFRIRTLVDEALVLEGQTPREGAEPYVLWRSAIRRLCLHTELSDRDASILKVLIPDIDILLQRDVADAPAIDQQARQDRLLDIVEKLFRQQQQPVVLLLEDLQWVSDNLPILTHICRIIHELPMLIIGCYRDDERPDLSEQIPCSQVLKLNCLDKESIRELSAAMLGDVGKEGYIVDLLEYETQGNPFFIVEIVRALAEEAGQLDKVGITTLPKEILSGGVQEFVQRRLNTPPPDAQALLRLAAVAGQALDLKLMYSLAPDMNLEDWLSTCADVSILEVHDNQWRFADHQAREQLLADMSDEEYRTLNERVADAATALYGDDEDWAAYLAYCWTEAGQIAEAFDYSSKAGAHALQTCAYRDAANHFEKALTFAEQMIIMSDKAAELQYQLGLTYTALGNSSQAQPCFEAALLSLGLPVYTTPPRLALNLVAQIIKQVSYRRFPRLVRQTKLSGRQRSILLRASNIYVRLGEINFYKNRPLPAIHAAIACANYADAAGGNTLELTMAYGQLSLLLSAVPALQDIAEGYAKRTRAIAEQTDDPLIRAWAYGFTGAYYGAQGEWELCHQDAEISTALHAELGDQRYYNQNLLIDVYALIRRGYFVEGLDLLKLIAPQAERRQDVQMLLWASVINIDIGCSIPGVDIPALLDKANHLLPQNPAAGDQILANGILARAFLQRNKPDLAQEHAAQALDFMTQTKPLAWHVYPGYTGTVATYLGLWEIEPSPPIQEAAQQAIKSLTAFARVFPFGKVYAQLYQSHYLWLAGKTDKALTTGLKALEAAQGFQMPYEEGLAHYELGRHLSGNDPRRVEHLNKAADIFEELGTIYDLEQARAALSQ